MTHLSRATFLCIATTLGCYSTSLLQEPNVLAPGKVRVAAGVAYDFDKQDSTSHPSPELAARVGIAKNTELRAKGSISGLEFGANLRAYENERMRLVVMPQYREYWDITEDRDSALDENYEKDIAVVRALAVPVVAAVRTPSGIEPFVGAGLHTGRTNSKGFGAAALHLGVNLPLGEHVSVIPECSALVSIVGPRREVKNDDGDFVKPVLTPGDGMFQCGMGLSFGSAYP